MDEAELIALGGRLSLLAGMIMEDHCAELITTFETFEALQIRVRLLERVAHDLASIAACAGTILRLAEAAEA